MNPIGRRVEKGDEGVLEPRKRQEQAMTGGAESATARSRGASLHLRREPARELLPAARRHLEALHQAFGGRGHAVALSGPDGVVLFSRGSAGWLPRTGWERGAEARRGTGAAASIPGERGIAGAVHIAAEPGTESEMAVLAAYAAEMIGRDLRSARQSGKDVESGAATATRLAAIIQGSEDAIFTKDLDGIILSWNPGAQKIYGYAPEEIVGRPVTALSPPDRVAEIAGFMERLRKGEAIEHVESVRVRKDGARRDVSLAISPLRDEGGRIVGASTIARDITDRKRSEQALRQTEKLAATGRLAASIAHEINNPMASVTNLLYLLQHNSSLDPTARQHVTLAQEELQRIAHITRQMLGFYREAQAPVPVDLGEVLENVLALYARKIKQLNIRMVKRIEAAATVQAFPGEMRQVLSNLVLNALEVSPEGGVLSLRVREGREWREADRRGVRVTVADSGPGIPPQHRRNIFEPFFTTKGERGTGLGLWVSNGIVRKHGGRIRVRSSTRPGRSGTCFSVFLPHQAANDAGQKAAPKA